ncbi:integrase [Streptomyces sp. TE4109]
MVQALRPTCERSPGRTSSRPGTLSPANSAKAGSSRYGSLFRHTKKSGQIFRNPTIRIRVPRQTGGVLQALVQADIDEAIATATTPDIRLIVALAAVRAARPKMIRTMQLEDVDLGNRRVTVGGHVRPLDDLTHRAVLDWLGYRRSRWPNTANPHLLITQKTAVELGPAGKLWTTRATRNLTATLEQLRVDRQLEEALTHGADPLHLALVFGIDEKTAIRYADSARALLEQAAEHSTVSSAKELGPER